ncbi:M28 family metallopeptidase [Flavobacterium difficile]|uniref:M28 family peptidase n=1 Tax=Flavobacterium difficile TaxID=2709659 RepID=A0ABX0I0Y5_9FLAO|nr:M28 family metallopeptidase [Flavobacterium difficile]NHM00858.1 M28 family peptidase [Flavobacterium difficile]
MKKSFYLFAASLFLLSCSTKKNIVSVRESKVVDPTKYMNTINEASLSKNLHVIASDEMEGRNTGEPGQKKAGLYIIEQYKALGIKNPPGSTDYYQKVPSEFMKKGFSPKLGDSENIWAFIPGAEKPEEVLVISAHYDHVGMKNGEVFNGADDDGSGTVSLIEIAKAFMEAKKEGFAPKRSILFLHVTGEEHGLHGSRYYSENPLFPLKNTVADINIDMVGRRDTIGTHKENGKYIYVIGSDRLSSELHAINEQMNAKYVGLNLDYTFNARNDPNQFYFRSDHYNFAKKGVPSIFFFNGVHEDYHGPNDTADKIEYDLLTLRVKLAFTLAWELANRENKIVVDKDGK